MATITLENIPHRLHSHLQDNAARHHHSLHQEVIAALEAALLLSQEQRVDEELEAISRQLPTVDHTLIDTFKHQGRL